MSMNAQEKVARPRLSVLQLVEALGNVSVARRRSASSVSWARVGVEPVAQVLARDGARHVMSPPRRNGRYSPRWSRCLAL